MAETKDQRFVKAAAERVNGITTKISKLSVFGSARYEYTDQQIDKMVNHLKAELDKVGVLLKQRKKAPANEFKF